MRNKYGAKKTVIDGIRFASMVESRRYLMLKAMQDSDEIYGLELQPRYELYVKGFYVGRYTADFKYYDDSGEVVEDVKGMAVDAATRLRLKIVKAIYGIEVKIWREKDPPKRKKKAKKVTA